MKTEGSVLKPEVLCCRWRWGTRSEEWGSRPRAGVATCPLPVWPRGGSGPPNSSAGGPCGFPWPSSPCWFLAGRTSFTVCSSCSWPCDSFWRPGRWGHGVFSFVSPAHPPTSLFAHVKEDQAGIYVLTRGPQHNRLRSAVAEMDAALGREFFLWFSGGNTSEKPRGLRTGTSK